MNTFTTITQVAHAVAREIGVPGPAYANDYPYRYEPLTTGVIAGMGHRGSGRGEERRYWVKLLDGREFLGTKAQLLDWAAMHLPSDETSPSDLQVSAKLGVGEGAP